MGSVSLDLCLTPRGHLVLSHNADPLRLDAGLVDRLILARIRRTLHARPLHAPGGGTPAADTNMCIPMCPILSSAPCCCPSRADWYSSASTGEGKSRWHDNNKRSSVRSSLDFGACTSIAESASQSPKTVHAVQRDPKRFAVREDLCRLPARVSNGRYTSDRQRPLFY